MNPQPSESKQLEKTRQLLSLLHGELATLEGLTRQMAARIKQLEEVRSTEAAATLLRFIQALDRRLIEGRRTLSELGAASDQEIASTPPELANLESLLLRFVI
jgi:hypothetical protein